MYKDLLKENITAATMTRHVVVYCLKNLVATTSMRKHWPHSTLNWGVNVLPVVTSVSYTSCKTRVSSEIASGFREFSPKLHTPAASYFHLIYAKDKVHSVCQKVTTSTDDIAKAKSQIRHYLYNFCQKLLHL